MHSTPGWDFLFPIGCAAWESTLQREMSFLMKARKLHQDPRSQFFHALAHDACRTESHMQAQLAANEVESILGSGATAACACKGHTSSCNHVGLALRANQWLHTLYSCMMLPAEGSAALHSYPLTTHGEPVLRVQGLKYGVLGPNHISNSLYVYLHRHIHFCNYNMYINMYTYIYIHVYTHVCMSIYMYIHICVYRLLYSSICVYIYTHIMHRTQSPHQIETGP